MSENSPNCQALRNLAQDDNSTDKEDPSSPTSTPASASVNLSCLPDFWAQSESSKVFHSFPAKPLLSQALHSETMHSKTPSLYKARKSRRKAYMHTPFLIGVKLRKSSLGACALYPSVSKNMENSVETSDWVFPPEGKALQSPFDGTKLQHLKGKFLEDMGNESWGLFMKKACHGDVTEKSDVLDANQQHPMHGNLDASEEAWDKEQGDINAKETNRKGGRDFFGQQAHFVAWFAALLIRSLWFQLRLLSHVCTTLLVAWYHSFLFALNPVGYTLRAIEAHRKKKNHVMMSGPKLNKRAFTIQPIFVKGARRLAFGFSTAFYTIMILTVLLIMSLMLGHLVVRGLVHEPIQLFEDLHFDYTKPLPVASIDFPFSKAYPDTSNVMRRITSPTRKFCARVFFTLPESDFNKELGIFQVTTQLLSVTGQVLLSTTQPCMLRFSTVALQRAKSLLLAIPLLTGIYSETQTLVVSLLEWHERGALSFAAVKVMIAPRAGRPSAVGLPELYEAKIHVDSTLPWWVSMIDKFRWTLAVWIGLVFFIGVVVLLMSMCRQLLVPDLGCASSFIMGSLKYGKLVSEPALKGVQLGSKHSEMEDT